MTFWKTVWLSSVLGWLGGTIVGYIHDGSPWYDPWWLFPFLFLFSVLFNAALHKVLDGKNL